MNSKRAAQYLRMSTEHQKYSFENQAATIAAYARVHDLEIVETYSDAARSGVSITGRHGIKRLLTDVMSGAATYSEILVYDVSRWGRYQDPDQAAHYEYLCREAGFKVRYCAECFGDDGFSSTIMKHIKRVMAGEYSRELSVKVQAAHRRQAALGFSQGGVAPLGFRRQLLDCEGAPKKILTAGERKAIASERVVWVLGPPGELEVVRRIFKLYVNDGLSIKQIARDLHEDENLDVRTMPWTQYRVRRVLTNDIYLGNYVYGKSTKPLGAAVLRTEESAWIRSKISAPIVSRRVFSAAQKRIAGYPPRLGYSKAELLSGLQAVHRTHGQLSTRLIDATERVPSSTTYRTHFGSMFNAYAAIGSQGVPRATQGRGNWRQSDDTLLDHLRRLQAQHGFVTCVLISADRASPCVAYYVKRFGKLVDAYRLAGIPHDRGEIQKAARRRLELRIGDLLGNLEKSATSARDLAPDNLV